MRFINKYRTKEKWQCVGERGEEKRERDEEGRMKMCYD
jgi:hypothetical protein